MMDGSTVNEQLEQKRNTPVVRRKRCVRAVTFADNIVASVITRPYTRRSEVEKLFYQTHEFAQFRADAQQEKTQVELEKYGVDEIENYDCPSGTEFCAFTSVFSVFLFIALIFAYVLSGVERYARSFSASSSTTPLSNIEDHDHQLSLEKQVMDVLPNTVSSLVRWDTLSSK